MIIIIKINNGFISLNMMSSGFIHVVRSDRISSFSKPSNIPLYTLQFLYLFIHSQIFWLLLYLGFGEQCWSAKTLEYLLGYWEVLVSPV